ncbi:MAG: DUF2262 domain-containing protein [Verrucomicrobiaceae bacterium]|nr:DUF2262 domain-containing protein [Verrucomicrobiaceae bacterium]
MRKAREPVKQTLGADRITVNPSTLTHARFGILHFNTLLEWYESELHEPGVGRFKVCIDLNDDGTLAEILARAESAFDVAITRYPESVFYAASKLTSEYNHGWNDGDAISESEFRRRISLSSLVLHYGRADFYFDDGGLFAGHSIRAEMESDGTFTDAVYEG